jgi:hypothetical protein
MAGLVPAISIIKARRFNRALGMTPCIRNRDRRDKPGDDIVFEQ